MLAEFGKSPNYLVVDGRPVISTYSGTRQWGSALVEKLAEGGVRPFFVPNYQYLSSFPWARNYSMPSADFLDRLYREDPELDGYFFFGPDLGYKSPPTYGRIVAEQSKLAGKVAMTGISPFYRGLRGNFRVFESGGFEGMAAQWTAAIESGADWVEIVTWNDWGEATYVAPYGGPREQDLWNYHWGPLLSHEGFLDASDYFIEWFKSAKPPKIERDRIFYFYRLHAKTTEGIASPDSGEQGRPRGWQDLDDRLYITAFLTRPLTVDATIGDRHASASLDSGVTHRRFDIGEGAVSLSVRDARGVIATKQLEFPITRLGQIGNFNYFSGEIALP
jgi:glucan endo-1,3-alpha-glucosidase